MSNAQNLKNNLEQIIKKLPSRFQESQALDLEAIYQFRLIDDISFYIEISKRKCLVHFAEHDDPNIILIMTSPIFIDLMTGEIDGMSAYLKGDLKAHGNVLLATKLGKLFKKREGDEEKIINN